MSALLFRSLGLSWGAVGGQLVYMLLGNEPKMNIDLSQRR